MSFGQVEMVKLKTDAYASKVNAASVHGFTEENVNERM